MRLFAVLFALISLPVIACEAIPASMKFKTLSSELMTLTGNLTMTIEFVDLNTTECQSERSGGFRINNGAKVSVSSTGRNVQSFTTSMTYARGAFYISKPANMVMGGVEVNMLPSGQIVMFYDGAAMRPTATF